MRDGPVTIAADPQAEAWDLLGADFLKNGLQAVVSTGAAAWPETNLAKAKVEVVDDDQHILRLDLVPPHDLADRNTASIHVGLRHDKDQTIIAVASFGYLRVHALARRRRGRALRHLIDNKEAEIVPGLRVLPAGIPQSDHHLGPASVKHLVCVLILVFGDILCPNPGAEPIDYRHIYSDLSHPVLQGRRNLPDTHGNTYPGVPGLTLACDLTGSRVDGATRNDEGVSTMFGVGYQEMLLIGLAALLLFGPGKLPEVMGQAGKWYKQFRDVTSELTGEFEKTVAEAKGEFEGAVGDLGPMQKQVNSITKSVQKDLGVNGKGKTTTAGKKTTTSGTGSKAKSSTAAKSSSKSTSTSKTTSSRTSNGASATRTNQTKKSSMTTGKPVVNASKEDPFASVSLFEQPERPTKRRARSATPSALTDRTPRDIVDFEPDGASDATAATSAPATAAFDPEDPIARARQRRLRAGYAQATA